jgi:hypothetical protein
MQLKSDNELMEHENIPPRSAITTLATYLTKGNNTKRRAIETARHYNLPSLIDTLTTTYPNHPRIDTINATKERIKPLHAKLTNGKPDNAINDYINTVNHLDRAIFPRHDRIITNTYNRHERIGEGTETRVYHTNHDGIVLKLYKDRQTTFNDLRNYYEHESTLPPDVNLARILDAGTYEHNNRPVLAEITEHAHGQPLAQPGHTDLDHWRAINERLADAPQPHYDKLIEDTRAIRDAGIEIDPIPENLFYDETNGFTWIDTCMYTVDMPDFVILLTDLEGLHNDHRNSLTPDDITTIERITDKVTRAGNPGNKEWIDERKRQITALKHTTKPS